MSNPLTPVVSIAGRVLLCIIFCMSAVGNKIPHFDQVAEVMGKVGMPSPRLLLVGAITFLLLGSASVILGYQARIGAVMLLVFLAMASYYFHAFWKLPEAEQQAQMIHFMKNLSMIGAMLFIIANGSGAGSLDTLLARHAAANELPA
ncbi:MAG TPA: DoxX family protein [Pirellulales bacterium]|jgi:putative oxidoreductase